MMSHMTPLLSAIPCPEQLVPSNGNTAVKAAIAGEWAYAIEYAIGPLPDGTHSVLFRARRHGVLVACRWEAKAEAPRKMGFVSGWSSPGPLGWPSRLGWREVIAALKESASNEELCSRDVDEEKNPLTIPTRLVIDADGDITDIMRTDLASVWGPDSMPTATND